MTQLSQRDERGIAHLLLMAAGVGVFFVVIFAGYVVFGNHKNNNNAANYVTPFDRCLNAHGNDQNICNYQKNYQPLNTISYTSVVNVTSPQGVPSNLTYSNDGKGNTMVVGNSNGQQLSSIVLNSATYVKESGSSWVEYPGSDATAPAQINPTASMNVAVGQANLSFQYQDTESCGSLSCYKYSITDSTQQGETQTIWFDITSYKLREWSYHGSTGSTTMTISYQPVTISAPSPVSMR